MRKSAFLMAIATAVLLGGGCEREQDVPTPDGKWAGLDPAHYLTAFDMRTEKAETRAGIDFTSGAITWNEGDRVLVYVPATGESAAYSYGSTCFEPVDAPLQIGTNEAYAYYPSDASTYKKTIISKVSSKAWDPSSGSS